MVYVKRHIFKLVNVLTFSAVCCYCSSVTFNEVTDIVFHNNIDCVLAAFGDFNSDKLTDVFCLRNKGTTLEILFAQDRKQILPKNTISCSVDKREIISSVMPGDFNGDSMLDVLITVKKQDKTDVRILWGNLDKINCTTVTNFSSKSEPLVMDFNGDMIPDIFVVNESGFRSFWAIEKSTLIPSEKQQLQPNVKQGLSLPHSCAFLDLNYDLEADLFVTGENVMEYWLHLEDDEMGSYFNRSKEINYPEKAKKYGQSAFVDINGDGILEHIMPVCNDVKCSSCTVMIRSLNDTNWKDFSLKLSYKNESWCFKDSSRLFNSITLPMILRSADFDMDGMPDFLTVVENDAGSESRALLLKNVPCPECPFGRTLLPLWNLLESIRNVTLASFYEIFEDGIIDILINTNLHSEYKLHAFQNMLSADAYFIKVLVVGGQCYDACPGNHVAYGINQPGPSITYKTTGPDGLPRIGSMTQLSQSAHFALQLPYSIFGLGQTPNFVDELQVIVPGAKTMEKRQRTWTQIIPNSQIVVIPYPPENSKFWMAKLFVTPSQSILLTFFALVGTCIFICFIIGALHWKERRADRRERLLEAHRFHFDAM